MLFEILNRLGIFRYGKDSKLVRDVYHGTFKIEGGALILPSIIREGQHFAIIGSDMNDGAYRYGVDTLTDEVFNGIVYVLRENRAFFDLVDEMEKWQDENGAKLTGVYTSESFGGYSYTKDSNASDVFKAFDNRLKAWRKA